MKRIDVPLNLIHYQQLILLAEIRSRKRIGQLHKYLTYRFTCNGKAKRAGE
jgi:hypothetical protein